MEVIYIAVKITPNKYDEFDTYAIGYLNNGETFTIDKEDLEKIRPYNWRIQKGNICTSINRKTIQLSRFILDIKDNSKKILRINKNEHDYRKSNLFAGNTYKDCGDYYEGYCFNGECFLIDKDDYELIKPHVWHVDKNGYVIAKIGSEIFKQHRLILGLGKTDPREVDHIHHNQLDNRKTNLRIVNRSQNCINKRLASNNVSGVKGVYKSSDGKTWIAQISLNRQKIYLGSFQNIEAATQTRKEAEIKYHRQYICEE